MVTVTLLGTVGSPETTRLAEALVGGGFRIRRIDVGKMSSGRSAARIASRITRDSDAVVVCLTERTNHRIRNLSAILQKVIQYGLREANPFPILRVFLDAAADRRELGGFDTVDLSGDWKSGVQRLAVLLPYRSRRPERKPRKNTNSKLPAEVPPAPRFAIVWDPAVVPDADYVEVVLALGDLVRSVGGYGIQRVGEQTIPVAVREGVLV